MIFFFTGDQRNLVSGNFLSICFDPFHTFLNTFRFMDLNMIFPVIIVYILLSRFIVSGVALGGVKG